MGFKNKATGSKLLPPITKLNDIKVEINLDNIPDAMKEYDQWVCWSHIERENQGSGKLPVYTNTAGNLGLSKWSQNLLSFDDAVTMYESSDLIHGVGFVFTDDDPFVFIDFDKLKPDDERLKWIENKDTFIEWSQSGKGLHMIVDAKLGKAHQPSTGEVEIYSNKRFCAMTGNLAGGGSTNIVHDQLVVDALILAYPYTKDKSSKQRTQNGKGKSKDIGKEKFKLPKTIPDGTRDDTIFKYACSLFATEWDGSNDSKIAEKVHSANEDRCEPPLESTIVDEKIEQAKQYAIAEAQQNDDLIKSELLDRFTYLTTPECYIHNQSLQMFSTTAFNAEFSRDFSTQAGIGIAHRLFCVHEDRTMVSDITWIPTGIDAPKNRIVEVNRINYFNTWQGIECKARKGSIAPWTKLLKHLIPDAKEREAVIDWMSFQVQFPEKKLNWQIIHNGTHGCGKDSLYKPLGMIFGHSAGVVAAEELHSNFNSYLIRKKFLILEEIYKPGMRDFDIANKLKLLAASSAGGTMTINEKFKVPTIQANVLAFVALSNHEDCLFVENSERRYFGIKSECKPLDPKFYMKYYDWLDNEAGYECLYDYLLKRDISKMDLNIPFETEATKMLKATSVPEYEVAISEMIESNQPPFNMELVFVQDIMMRLKEQYQRSPGTQKIGQILKKKGFDKYRGLKSVKGKPTPTPTFWAKTEAMCNKSRSELFDFYQKNVHTTTKTS